MDPNITYEIESHHEFLYDSDSGQSSIKYHHGRSFFNGGTAPMDVSFVPFENSTPSVEVAQILAQIFERSNKVSHDRVMRPWFFTYDGNLRKHIMCYDRFTEFLPESSPSWLSQPLLSSDIPGLPNQILKREIRELAMGLEHLHNNDVSHSALNSPLSYVWSNDKIKMINIDDSKFDFWDELHPSESEKQWQQRKLHHINQFGIGLKYLLSSKLVWPEKDSFLRCFALTVSLDRYLKMVYTHPFLMEHMKKILQLLADAHHAYISQDGGGLRVDILNLAFQRKVLDCEYLRPEVGWRRQMGTEFTKIIQFVHTTPPPKSSGSSHTYSCSRAPPLPPSPSQSARDNIGHQPSTSTFATAPTTTTPPDHYKTNVMSDLLRFLRNVFEHYYQQNMSLFAFYEEVRKHWAHFVDRIHERV